LVNDLIEKDLPVYTKPDADKDDALKINTLRAVFGETYPDKVRVVSVGADIDAMLADPKDPKWMNHPVEFCGGTHLKHTGEAERFVLISEEAVAKGIRRLVGITGEAAKQAEEDGRALLAEAAALADKPPVAPGEPRALARADSPAPGDGPDQSRDRKGADRIPNRDRKGADRIPNRDREGADRGEPHTSACAASREPVDQPTHKGSRQDKNAGVEPARTSEDLSTKLSAFQKKVNDATISIRVRRELQDHIAELQKQARKQQKQAASASGDAVMNRVASLLESAEDIGGAKIVVGEVPSAPADALRGAIDWVRNKVGASAVLLAMADDGKVTLIAGISKDMVSKGIKAGDLIKEIAPLIGGRGGGRPDMAQGGGNDPAGLPAALDQAKTWIRKMLG